MSWRSVCIYDFLPLELAVFVCKRASTMILLFDMWIENVGVYGEIEPSKSMEKIIHFKNSLNTQVEAQKLRINILIISAHLSHS